MLFGLMLVEGRLAGGLIDGCELCDGLIDKG